MLIIIRINIRTKSSTELRAIRCVFSSFFSCGKMELKVVVFFYCLLLGIMMSRKT